MTTSENSLTDAQLDERVDALVQEIGEVSEEIVRAVATRDQQEAASVETALASGGPIGDAGDTSEPDEPIATGDVAAETEIEPEAETASESEAEAEDIESGEEPGSESQVGHVADMVAVESNAAADDLAPETEAGTAIEAGPTELKRGPDAEPEQEAAAVARDVVETEPETESAAEPAAEPVSDPVSEPVSEPVSDPVIEPGTEIAAEPETATEAEPVAVDAASDEIANEISQELEAEDSETEPGGAATPGTPPLDTQIETMLTDVDAGGIPAEIDDDSVIEPAAQETPAAPSTAQGVDFDLPPEDEAGAAPAAAAPAPDSLEDLDAELAGLAGDLLEGDFDDVDSVLEGEDIEAAPEGNTEADSIDLDAIESNDAGADPEAVEAAEAETDDEPATSAPEAADADPSDAGSEADVAAPSAPEGQADTEVEPGAESAPEAASETESKAETEAVIGTDEPAEAAGEEASQPAETVAAVGVSNSAPRRLLAGVGAAVYGTAVAMCKPLESKPTYARDIVGWFAAVTLFSAVAVWGFWLLVRTPGPGDPSTEVAGLETPAQAEPASPGVPAED